MSWPLNGWFYNLSESLPHSEPQFPWNKGLEQDNQRPSKLYDSEILNQSVLD